MLWESAELRRQGPRVHVESLCSEIHAGGTRPALVLDMSEGGIRIQRPLGGPRTRVLQLELEIPGIDELVWATGTICFDEVWPVQRMLMRTSGVHLVAAASRHQRLLREFVLDSWHQRLRRHEVGLLAASCYARG